MSDNNDNTDRRTEQRTTGTVDFYNDTGEYGFIRVEAMEEDVFFDKDASELTDEELSEENILEFTVEDAEKGPRACDIELVEVVETEEEEEDTFEEDNWAGEDSDLTAEEQQSITDFCNSVKELNKSDKRIEDELSELDGDNSRDD